MVEFADVSTAFGLELAWQSTQDAGCGCMAAVSDAWNNAGVVPARLVDHVATSALEGGAWQTAQS